MQTLSRLAVKYFWILIFIGFVLRLVLAGTTAWSSDISVWHRSVGDIKSGVGIYTNMGFSYPPGMAVLFYVIYLPIAMLVRPELWGTFSETINIISIKSWLFSPIITSPFFNFYTKLPLFIAEIALLYVLYLIYRQEFSNSRLKLIGLIFYLNPLVIFVSAVHAQFDIFVVLAVAVSVLFIKNEKLFLAGLLLGVATTMKIYAVFLFLPYLDIILFHYYPTYHQRRTISKFAGGFAIPVVLMISFMALQPSSAVSTFARVSTIGFEGSLNLGFINYLPWLHDFIARNTIFLNNFMQLGLGLTPLFGLATVHFLIRKFPRFGLFLLESASVTTLFLVYLFSSRTNPTYLIWVLPFMTVLVVAEVISFWNLLGMSLAAILFYFGVNYLSWKVLFFPLVYFGNSLNPMVDQYNRFLNFHGLINTNIMADVFLFSAIWFIWCQIKIYIQIFRRN